jgi:hypothetical protein
MLPDGSPVPGARVYAMAWTVTDPLPPPATPWPDPVPDPSGREPVASGLDGAYRHAGLCAGEYAIFAMIELPMGRLQGMHERSAGNPLIRLERSDSIAQGIDVRLQPVAPPDPNVGPTPPGSGARPPGAATATATASATPTATATAAATAAAAATATP